MLVYAWKAEVSPIKEAGNNRRESKGENVYKLEVLKKIC